MISGQQLTTMQSEYLPFLFTKFTGSVFEVSFCLYIWLQNSSETVFTPWHPPLSHNDSWNIAILKSMLLAYLTTQSILENIRDCCCLTQLLWSLLVYLVFTLHANTVTIFFSLSQAQMMLPLCHFLTNRRRRYLAQELSTGHFTLLSLCSSRPVNLTPLYIVKYVPSSV